MSEAMQSTEAEQNDNAPAVAHRIADLEMGEIIGYEAEQDIFGIKIASTRLGEVATDAALQEGYVVTRVGSHPDDDYNLQVQFQNIAEK